MSAKDLVAALDLYKVTDGKREALLTLARTAKQRGWWDRYDSIRADYANYISLEAEADTVKCYCSMLIHGLLQTEKYAQAVIRSALMSLLPPAEISRRVDVRMTRQEALRRQPPLKIWAVLDKAVLRRMTGGAEAMREQCRHLVEVAESPNVTIQVLPYALGAHPGTVEFSILEFPEPYDPDAVYVETMTSSLYIEDDTDVYRYTLAFDQLRAMALGPDESIEMICRVAESS
ncbi:XRE family transcriptional regulator [Sphaerisporangium album]|uniref:XRE family transcriptional regulator n=1 Tax=Sphaerisporangium album TaxID=509200 RepID=A0A367FQQ0_9ACTN|nr:DUF5753 domain-containing protein [Sphaerisporangium album]RCG32037.1 XRE family transcriptional regulator [Sphaerisporangium album]